MLRSVIAYAAAVVVTFGLSSAAHTQVILSDLAAMGVPVDVGLRISQTFADMSGLIFNGAMVGLFPAIIAIGMLAAFLIGGLVARLTPGLRWFVFMAAGGIAMLVIFAALKSSVGTVGLFGARGMIGHILQAGAGAIGGLVFTILKPRVA